VDPVLDPNALHTVLEVGDNLAPESAMNLYVPLLKQGIKRLILGSDSAVTSKKED
jgi:hypothetical protein